jgi:hypothetical protein
LFAIYPHFAISFYFLGISLRGVVLFFLCEHGDTFWYLFPGRVIIIYVFQATEIEWGGNKGPAEQSYFRAPPPQFSTPFLYIDTKYSSVW